jgi:hypothetical protein
MDGLVPNRVAASIFGWRILGLVQDPRSAAQFGCGGQSSGANLALPEACRSSVEWSVFHAGRPPIACRYSDRDPLYRYLNLDLPRPNLPNIERWYERLQSRSAYLEHVCVPFDELYGRLDF